MGVRWGKGQGVKKAEEGEYSHSEEAALGGLAVLKTNDCSPLLTCLDPRSTCHSPQELETCLSMHFPNKIQSTFLTCWFPEKTELPHTQQFSHDIIPSHLGIKPLSQHNHPRGLHTGTLSVLCPRSISPTVAPCSFWARCGGYFGGVEGVRKKR